MTNIEPVKDHLYGYIDELGNLKSGKGESYFSDETTRLRKKSGEQKSKKEIKAGNVERRKLEERDTRVLQFIFDRVKAHDPLELNEIYSHTKKYRQLCQQQANSSDIEDIKRELDKTKRELEKNNSRQQAPRYIKNPKKL